MMNSRLSSRDRSMERFEPVHTLHILRSWSCSDEDELAYPYEGHRTPDETERVDSYHVASMRRV